MRYVQGGVSTTMMLADDWMFWAGLGVVGVGLLGVMEALAGDWFARLRVGRGPGARGLSIGVKRVRRCPRCWYEMEGVAGVVCPECGRDARRERRLYRTRRRRRWAVPGLAVMVAGAGVMEHERLERINWIAYAPTWLLVELVDDTTPDAPPGIICFLGNPSASQGGPDPQPEDRSAAIVAEIWRRYAAGELSLSLKRTVLNKQFDNVRGPIRLHSRARWPVGVPVLVDMTPQFSGPYPREGRAVPRLEGGETLAAISPDPWLPPGDEAPQAIGVVPAGTKEVVFDVTLEEEGEIVWEGTTTLAVEIGGTIDDVLEPVRGDASGVGGAGGVGESGGAFGKGQRWSLNERLEGWFRETLWVTEDGASVVASRPRWLVQEGLAVAVRVEVLDGGEVVAETRFVLGAAAWGERERRYFMTAEPAETMFPLRGDTGRIAQADRSGGRWTVRITGDGETSLSDFDATRYWAGEVVIPMMPGR